MNDKYVISVKKIIDTVSHENFGAKINNPYFVYICGNNDWFCFSDNEKPMEFSSVEVAELWWKKNASSLMKDYIDQYCDRNTLGIRKQIISYETKKLI